MNRNDFLQKLLLLPLGGLIKPSIAMTTEANNLPEGKMPVLFLGHGSPMNAIEENDFVAEFRKQAQKMAKPKAIICVSAHWETNGTFLTAMEKPKTIHDFGGFPKALYEVQYPAAGHPELARKTKELVHSTEVGLDLNWGLDHGAWSVLKHLYPAADVPVIQLSLDYRKPPAYHYALAKELAQLRKQGVLIVGSGNMVHNLGLVAWNRLNEDNYAYDWALEASSKMRQWILDGNHQALVNFGSQGKAFQLAIPTPEHYLPLLYILALKDKNEAVNLFNDKALGGSLTMTSVRIG